MAKFALFGLISGAAAEVKVMVFGDSYGDTGPKYSTLQDMFDQRSVAATVKNAAVGGTTSCGWAGEESGMQMVNKANDLFGANGPDYVWYTLGGNDIWNDDVFQNCQKSAKGQDASVIENCIDDFNTRIIDCHSIMFDNFFESFPNAKVIHHGYDIPCESSLCDMLVNGQFARAYCGSDNTCLNTFLQDWNTKHLSRLQAKYPQPGFSAVPLIGAVQKANNVAGADYNKPVLTKGANCKWETLCIHPTHNTPAGQAWGDGMWEFYYSKEALAEMSEIESLV